MNKALFLLKRYDFAKVQISPAPIATPARLKTRIAPTPSGYLHLGNVFSFVLTVALAEKNGARILLRIDDMDRERVRPEYIQDIFDTLHFLELPWHEGPQDAATFEREYSQLHRMPLYREALQQLKDGGHIFACNCSRSMLAQHTAGTYNGACLDKQLDPDTPNLAWRLRTDTNTLIPLQELNGPTRASLPQDQQYFVVRKRDGYPAYQLSSLVDDTFFGVDLVVRGQDLYPSTLAQLYLAQVLGLQEFEQNIFYHHGLLASSAGAKLSKSAGATSVRYLRKEGKKPSDIYAAIGHMLGFKEGIRDRFTLAAAYFNSAF